LKYNTNRDYWRKWYPADFITESFPGQFRNWFYSMLAMATVLRREPPFETIFGYALVFGEDGRPMHKSWGNAIDFDEAAERMGVDVMRWLFAKARPEENILFGWHAADEARRELLVLWNVYAFFVTYARLATWQPAGSGVGDAAAVDGTILDRWIRSRASATAALARERLADVDTVGAARAISTFIDDLSTWYLRLSRKRFSRNDDAADRDAAFATLYEVLVAFTRFAAPLLPFLSESIYGNLAADVEGAPDSVHLTRWPADELAAARDEPLERAMTIARNAVELARTLRGSAGIRTRQPLARLWLALPGAGDLADRDALVSLIRAEVNVRAVELIGDESALVERRVKPLLQKIGKKLGSAIPAIMAAARENAVEYHDDGSVTLGGVTLAPDEVEILATPRPGTAVAHDEGLVVVIDTELTDDLRAEGDARELQRAIQDLRKEAGLALDDRIELWVHGVEPAVAAHLEDVAAETLARLHADAAPADAPGLFAASVELAAGPTRIALRRSAGVPA
jgi:isoleucyl-tRNA synthetase